MTFFSHVHVAFAIISVGYFLSAFLVCLTCPIAIQTEFIESLNKPSSVSAQRDANIVGLILRLTISHRMAPSVEWDAVCKLHKKLNAGIHATKHSG